MPRFRDFVPDQPFLMPQDLQEWLPKNHLARFVLDLVATLDLSAILRVYARPVRGGQPAYHPRMMVGLLLYGYAVGVCSSRKIQQATYERIDFRILAADQHPDHDSIAHFRKQHIAALADLFIQIVRICHDAGMIKLDHVAIDGTKLMANAAKSQTRTASALLAQEKKLQEQMRQHVQRILDQAEQIDETEDALYGPGNSGHEMPEELQDRAKRLAYIQEAVARLKQEAKERSEQQVDEAQQKSHEHETQNKRGRKPLVPDAAQVEMDLMQSDVLRTNLTDPDSRLMRDGATKAIVQGYNAQAAVDKTYQIIVAADVTADENDKRQLVPMTLQVEWNLGERPEEVSADTGYFSEAAVTDERLTGIRLLVPPDRACTQSVPDPSALDDLLPKRTGGIVWYRHAPTAAEQMGAKLRTPEGRSAYSARGQTVEPVFGQTKQCRGLRRFWLRGLDNVRAEWRLMCLGHNVRKLFAHKQGLPDSTRRPQRRTSPRFATGPLTFC